MLYRLILILSGSILGILLRYNLSFLSVFLTISLIFFVLLKKNKGILYLLISLSFFYTISDFKVKQVDFNENVECKVVQVNTNYYVIKSNGVKFVCYDDIKFNLNATITVKGEVKLLSNNKSDSVSSFNDYLNKMGINYELKIKEYRIISQGDVLRPKIKDYLTSNLEIESKNMVELLLLADKENMIDFYNKVKDLNIVHMFVISGFHLNLLGELINKIWPKSKNKIYCSFILLPYVWLLEFSIPVTRAFLYSIITKICIKYNVKIQKNEIIVILAILFLLIDYHNVFNLSYQLTFLTNFVLITFNNSTKKSVLFNVFITPIIVQLSIIPILLNISFQINVLGFILSSILSLPITILYVFSLIVSVIKILDFIYYFFVVGFINIIDFLSNLFQPVIMGKMDLILVVLFYLLFIMMLYFLTIQYKKRVIYILGGIILIITFQYYKLDLIGKEQVVFLNVNQGDSTLISGSNNSYHILIDTGGSLYYDVATSKTIPFLKSQGIRKLDLVIITHMDYDHYGALESLESNFVVENTIYGWQYDEIKIGDLTLHNLNNYYHLWNDKNDMSAVFYFKHANNDFLIMGDAPIKIEEKIIMDNHNLECDVIKIGHHGSKTSSSKNFLTAISPKLAIISVGNNSYGLPDSEVLNLLESLNILYFRTDMNANIRITSSGVRKNY